MNGGFLIAENVNQPGELDVGTGTRNEFFDEPIGYERLCSAAIEVIEPFKDYFGNAEPVEPESWVEADGLGKIDERMFICRAVGRSMEPTIRDKDYIVFRAKPAGTRQGKIVLAQYRGLADPDTRARRSCACRCA